MNTTINSTLIYLYGFPDKMLRKGCGVNYRRWWSNPLETKNCRGGMMVVEGWDDGGGGGGTTLCWSQVV